MTDGPSLPNVGPRWILVVALLVVAAGGVAALDVVGVRDPGSGLEERWLSDTGVPVSGNHHPVAAGRVDGRGVVFVPVNGEHGTAQCRMAALDAGDGAVRWRHDVPDPVCTIHAIGTPTLADYDADGTAEVLVPTSEERLYAFGPDGGEPELAHRLSDYGYSQAVVGPLGAGGERRIAVVDARGGVEVLHPDGSTGWSQPRDSYVWASPAVADVDGDGAAELVVGFGEGFVTAFERGGRIAWNRSLPRDGSVTWMTVSAVDDGTGTDVVVATEDGSVHRLDGTSGRIRWTREFGRLAAVEAVDDGDGDGSPEVYATARDGVLRALDAATGETEWAVALTDGTVQMTPPPVVGDVDGDGDPELVGVTSDGRVSVVDPTDGRVLATYERPTPIWEWGQPTPVWTRATLADADGDGRQEVYVVYGDGRVAALEYVGARAAPRREARWR